MIFLDFPSTHTNINTTTTDKYFQHTYEIKISKDVKYRNYEYTRFWTSIAIVMT